MILHSSARSLMCLRSSSAIAGPIVHLACVLSLGVDTQSLLGYISNQKEHEETDIPLSLPNFAF